MANITNNNTAQAMTRGRSRSRVRVSPLERDINRLIDQNVLPTTRGNSSIVRLGSSRLTTASGDFTERGKIFKRTVRGRQDLDQNTYSTDPSELAI